MFFLHFFTSISIKPDPGCGEGVKKYPVLVVEGGGGGELHSPALGKIE